MTHEEIQALGEHMRQLRESGINIFSSNTPTPDDDFYEQVDAAMERYEA